MNSPPEALSPSPSTPSSGSPSLDDVGLPTPSTSNAGGGGVSHAQLANILASPGQAQAKRRLPASSSSLLAGREGRENKSRRRDRGEDSDRDDGMRKGGGFWEPMRADTQGHAHGAPKARDELVDIAMVDYVRSTYGDPFNDTVLTQRNKSS